MDFHAGDTVMHWTHGLGTIIRREKRDLFGEAALYYAVRIGDMTIWVPLDNKVDERLRPPTPKTRFTRLVRLLASPGEPLPRDRHDRKLLLAEFLKDCSAESLVRIMRRLLTHRLKYSLNENDQAVLRRVRSALLAEWGYVLSLTPAEAELQLDRLVKSAAASQ
jgi:RNA polymerase-interacting CarD/CdnL/TRCF family regulator